MRNAALPAKLSVKTGKPVVDPAAAHARPPEGRSTTEDRRLLLIGKSEELDRHLLGVRASLLDTVILGLLVVALLALPAALVRTLSIGWLPVHSVQVALGIAAVLLFVFRRRLSVRSKAAAVIGVFWAVGLVTLIGLGLAGTGIWWLVLSSLLVSVLYSVRAGLIAMGLATAAMSLIGLAFCLEWLPLAFDSANQMRSPGAWITAIVGATLMPLVVFGAVAALNSSTIALLKKTGEQRELIRELATHDDLTGIPTFTLALDRLEQALRALPRSGRKVGLLFIDLDGFKAINDSLGHEAGDKVLAAVARRLSPNLRAEDTLARIGGDEFLAILSGTQTTEEVLAVAAKLQRLVRAPVEYREQEIVVGCSIGAAFAWDNRLSAEELIRSADAAMYEAKRTGSNQVRLAPPPNETPAA